MKIGDVVQLKSGGPRMTVTFPLTEQDATCIFFDGQGEYEKISVRVDCLKPAEEDKPVVKRRTSPPKTR